MTDNTEPKVDIEGFINKHLIKVFYGLIIYFLMQLSSDFKDIKTAVQQLLINQATIENRMTNLESSDKTQTNRLDVYDASRVEFYKTYKLTKKKDNE